MYERKKNLEINLITWKTFIFLHWFIEPCRWTFSKLLLFSSTTIGICTFFFHLSAHFFLYSFHLFVSQFVIQIGQVIFPSHAIQYHYYALLCSKKNIITLNIIWNSIFTIVIWFHIIKYFIIIIAIYMVWRIVSNLEWKIISEEVCCSSEEFLMKNSKQKLWKMVCVCK